ncbi:hypothetical protein FIBSPDRAFT_863141 [Athelia psychrophila]|uniref:Uncharacterized protein n=1 Tax=Athelia psychrophila TaxID=1759441 RepID=A0A166HT22_9AGAM|nr:hypothetical protein FIBSPDRAFT_863141 [Fibularhizoctonia sp. CBS 109695]
MSDSGARGGAQAGERTSESLLTITLLAMQAEGYSAIDLHDLAVRAMQQVVVRSTKPEDVDADAAVGALCQTFHLGCSRRYRMSEGEAHARLRQ